MRVLSEKVIADDLVGKRQEVTAVTLSAPYPRLLADTPLPLVLAGGLFILAVIYIPIAIKRLKRKLKK